MVFNATFNNNSVISWQSVLLMEETTVPPFIIINTKCPKNTDFQKLSCFLQVQPRSLRRSLRHLFLEEEMLVLLIQNIKKDKKGYKR